MKARAPKWFSAGFQFDSYQTDPVPDKTTQKGTIYYERNGKNFQMAAHIDEENGKQVSLHVDDAKFKASIHSTFGCVDCHADIKGFPHEPAPAKPKCATCHDGEQTAYDHGVHAKAAAAGNTNVAKCQDCQRSEVEGRAR